MKRLISKIRAYLLRNLAPKKIMALQLEKFVLKNEKITSVDISYGSGYNTVHVHYAGHQNIDFVFYNDSEKDMALRDFMFIAEVFKGQSQERKAK